MAFKTCFVVLYWSYCKLMFWLESCHSCLMSGLGEDFRGFRIVVWHWMNFVEGRIRLRPYLHLLIIDWLRVALMGNSSQWCTNLATIVSRFCTTHVLLRSVIVRCHAILERIKRWYNDSLYLGWQGIWSILVIISFVVSTRIDMCLLFPLKN